MKDALVKSGMPITTRCSTKGKNTQSLTSVLLTSLVCSWASPQRGDLNPPPISDQRQEEPEVKSS